MGPILIFDKSALQSLSMDEAVWLDAFFGGNVVPLFYVETLADLGKDVGGERSAERLVGMLAEKTPSWVVPNVHHHKIVVNEIAGGSVEMKGRPLIGAGDFRKSSDGKVGLHVEDVAEEQALVRWRNQDFDGLERASARKWRNELAQHDPGQLVAVLQNVLPGDRKISNLDHLKDFIDDFCSTDDPHVLRLAFQILQVPDPYVAYFFERWEAAGRTPMDQFLPYTTHVFSVDLLYYLGISRGFISGDRASNRVDMAYLYYLPFASIFTSGDGLHHRTVPLFLRDDQSYVKADELKAGLGEIDRHFEHLPDKVKETGVLAFARYPPSEMDNAVTRLWDRHARPDWRAQARMPPVIPDPESASSKATVDELNELMRTAQPIEDGERQTPAIDPDYLIVTRRVPATKGKWRMVSQEVEDAGSDDFDV